MITSYSPISIDTNDIRHYYPNNTDQYTSSLTGEEERCVSLCWRTARGAIGGHAGGWHRPRSAYGLSMLEFPPQQTHWKNGCPFAKSLAPLPIESQDLGASYYRMYFYKQGKSIFTIFSLVCLACGCQALRHFIFPW